MVLAIPLLLIAAILVAYGSAATAKQTANAFVTFLNFAIPQLGDAVAWVTKHSIDLAKYLTHALGVNWSSRVGNLVYWFTGLNQIAKWQVGLAFKTAFELRDFAQKTVTVYIPHAIHAAVGDLRKTVTGTVKVITKVERIVVHVPAQATTAARKAIAATIPAAIARELPLLGWIRKNLKAIKRAVWVAAAIAGAVPGLLHLPIHWPHGLTARQLRRLNRVWSRVFSTAGVAAIVALGLSALGLGWVRCSNVKKFGRSVCRMPTHLLDDLLGLLTDFLVLTNACALIPILEDGVKLVEPAVEAFTTGAQAVICYGRYPAPPTLNVPALHLPIASTSIPTLQLP